MSNLVKFGAKAANGTAVAVSANDKGQLVTEKNWTSSVVKLFEGTPTSSTKVSKSVSDNAMLSLRVVNKTGVKVKLSLISDLPPAVDISSFGWRVGGLANPSAEFFDTSEGYRRSVSTPNAVTISQNTIINVESGYYLYWFEIIDGVVQTRKESGSAANLTAGQYKFQISKLGSTEQQTSIDDFVSRLNIDAEQLQMKSLNEGEMSLSIPAENNKIFVITPNDWSVLNYLSSLNLKIEPESTISGDGKCSVYATLKK